MFPSKVASHLMLGFLSSVPLLSAQSPLPPATSGVNEFPVVLQHKVIAGKTPVGTKVTAQLVVATLENGTVIPRNAVFTGEVLESTAKTSTEPARLAIRMDSVQWKKGSASIKAFLTSWYYPTVQEYGQDLQYGPSKSAKASWNGQGEYPDRSGLYHPFPGSDSGQSPSAPAAPSSMTSNHRILMKNIEVEHRGDGSTVLVSKHGDIKFDSVTTYVLAEGNPLPAK